MIFNFTIQSKQFSLWGLKQILYKIVQFFNPGILQIEKNQHQMQILGAINKLLKPRAISCNDNNQEGLSFDQMGNQEQLDSAPSAPKKVPTFEGLLQPVLMVTGNMDFIKGFRFDINFPLSQHFSTSHSWNIPNSGQAQAQSNPLMPPQNNGPVYTFTTQLVRDIKGRQPTTVMVGKVDTDGKVDSIFIKKINQFISLRLTGQFISSNLDQGMVMLDLDYDNKDCNGQFKWGPGHWGVNYMQRVHKNVMLGFDYTNVYLQKMSAFSYAAKAFVKNHTILAQYMAMHQQFHLAYSIPIKRGSTFISHYKYDATSQKSSAVVGLKQRYMGADVVATLSSKLKLVTNCTLKGPSYGIRLCAQIDHDKNDYSFGYGVTIGAME